MILTMIIALVAMIGLTGLSSADGTGVIQVNGDASGYSMEYSGAGEGIVNINTYTDDGRDHKTVTYDNGMHGYQTVSITPDESTGIIRYDNIDDGGWMTTYSEDNTIAFVSTNIRSTQNANMFQVVKLVVTDNNHVESAVTSSANAEYSMGIVASTNDAVKQTSVTLVGSGQAEMGSILAADSDNSAIQFSVGDSTIPFDDPLNNEIEGTNGDGTLTVRTYSDEYLGLSVNGPPTYTFTSYPGRMVYTTVFDDADVFSANGYVYACTVEPELPTP